MSLRFLRRIQFWSRRARLDCELAEELEFHRAMKERENEGNGLKAEEARQVAHRQMGNLTQAREVSREVWSFPMWEQFAQDVSVALRSLRRDRGFAAVAILSLALGIGANTAIFTALNAVMLRPLPYPEPQQLYSVARPMKDVRADFGIPILAPEFQAWRNESRVFDQLTCWSSGELDFAGNGSPERIMVAEVPANFLTTLRISPTLGRNFRGEEDRPGAPLTAILTDGFWRRHFSGTQSTLGQQIKLNSRAVTIIGVLPPSFRFPGEVSPEVLLPAQLQPKPHWGDRLMHGVTVLGRLHPSVSPQRARADLDLISKRQEPDIPAWLHNYRRRELQPLRIIPLHDYLVGDKQRILVLLFSTVFVLLGIACANVVNLQLSRTAARKSELAVRAALGAGRARLARFLLTENIVLSLAGAVCGFVLAWSLVRILRSSPLLHLRDAGLFQIDVTVLAFTFLISVLVGFACGIFPALFASKPVLYETIKGGASRVFDLGSRFRGPLVVSEVALTLVLLVGALLLFRSWQNVLAVPAGFQSDNLVTFRTDFLAFRNKTTTERATILQSELASIRSIPGVRSVGASSSLPLTGYNLNAAIRVEGEPDLPPGQAPSAPTMMVSPDYFRTLHIPPLAGRSFTQQDTERSMPVAIINASFARRFFGNADPLGRRLHYGPASNPWVTIVGIVGDVHHDGLEMDFNPELFLPYAQNFLPPLIGIAVRTDLPLAAVLPAIREKIGKMNPEQPIFDVATMEHRLSESTGPRRMQTVLISSFAFIALCLATVGVYGVLSYSVSQTTREIGIRMALGAQKATVLRSVVRRGAMLAVSGIACGLVLAIAITRYLTSFLYHVKPLDGISFLAGALVIFAVAVLASYLPGRRAANVDPMVALRYE